jgi:hypothetical protein
MKLPQSYRFAFLMVLASLLPSCGITPPTEQAGVASVPSELVQQSYLYEVVRHLYRWYLDESEVERIIGSKEFTFWVRRLEVKLDSGDYSILAEILLPQLNIRLKVKKADYTIEELGIVVKSPNFKITQISRGTVPASRPLACEQVEVDMKEMRDYLFRTRNQQDYPDSVMVEHLRQALRRQLAEEGTSLVDIPPGEKIVHLAPLSPVANETWVFWEDGRKLYHFASDINLADPAVWEHETLIIRIFDLDNQVVVSSEEAPGSNRFLTRYQVSRTLFNCIVLGRRIIIPPL